jgi:hypothetical protein
MGFFKISHLPLRLTIIVGDGREESQMRCKDDQSYNESTTGLAVGDD